MTKLPSSSPMSLFARWAAFASFLLVIAGGMVTSTGSGLAVPDWPLSYGTLFPPMVGGILYEHSHRMIAATVGLLTLALSWSVLKTERRASVRWLAVACSSLVIVQGLLGGLTVLLLLPAPVSVAHATMGQTFFTAMVLLATLLSPRWDMGGGWQIDGDSRRIARAAGIAVAALYAQLVLGAALRHVGWNTGLVIAHLAGAGVATVLVARAAHGALHLTQAGMPLADPALGGSARIVLRLVALQLGLGFATFFLGKPVALATAHVAVGALLLASTAVLALRLFRAARPEIRRGLSIYLELTKPRLTALSVVSALVGFTLARTDPWSWSLFATLLVGTSLIGAGASALNQAMEPERDALMERTMRRPIPSGRISVDNALVFGVACSVAGLATLSFGVHPLAGALAAATLVSYLFIYTPLKPRSALCTLAGAVPGALPPLIGWAAGAGRLDLGAWLLFSILFLWQLPHFLALAWRFKRDYSRAGFKMLPVIDPDGGLTFRQMVLYTLALLPVSLLPAALGMAGAVYFSVALASGLAFLGTGVATAAVRSDGAAQRFFICSIVYLPCILATLTLDKVIL